MISIRSSTVMPKTTEPLPESAISRTPIREALRRLEQERLIADSGKGSVVLGITVEDLMDIMSIRKHVEGLVSYYAARNHSDEGIAELKRIVDLHDFYSGKQDYENMHLLDDQFHQTLCTISQRPVLRDTRAPLLRKTRRYRKISIHYEVRMMLCAKEHKEILNAIEAGDPDEAYRTTYQHISNARENLVQQLHYSG